MTVVDTRVSVWEALAGRAPGRPTGPADPGVWAAVVDRLNPARARPVLRPGIEQAELVSVRGAAYVMLKSPDRRGAACYLRLSPEEWRLAQLMDGSRTVARLVAEFVRISGRLTPEQVTRIVADLAGNRMLAELPVDAFRPLDRVHRQPWPVRLGRGMIAAAKGRRMVLANIDPLIGLLYRAGGRLLFTRVAAALLAGVAAVGLVVFGWTWWTGEQSVFLTDGSYLAGAAVLLGLNVLALACHELGHALATRHAGRRVPAAGFLIYFGIPSVFVDTTDVWMAGRRARILTTISGPAAGLILAGVTQIVGLLVPEAAPWTFKLAFAWYLNALFNFNPFLALDGYYLLMDWLEIPNLRARGLAYVLARLRRRPPRWAELDREGRLVALYGTLAVLWLVIAVNVGWRIWSDRVDGLVTGLWHAGWAARLLLAAVVAGLGAPLIYIVLDWLGRRYRAARAWWARRRDESDLPRRLDALRRSALGRLPAAALADLAAQARWVHPRTGEQLVFAGAAQPSVYVVVDGAMEARHPGDPAGNVRQRLGPGGVVGLSNALTGAPAGLSWHTAGTRLLAVPAPAVTRAIGPLAGPPPADRAAADALFGEAPALRGLTVEDRMGLICAARPVTVPPGGPVTLSSGSDAVVLESGVVALPDGTELRRGTMIGPAGEDEPGVVATARTPVRLWHVPAVPGLPLLLGTAPAGGSPTTGTPAGAAHGAPVAGVHPPADYPPLAAPPGPPPPVDPDRDVDRGFERKLWWLVLLLLLFALLVTGANLIPGPAWAEMPADKALLRADRGRIEATVDGLAVTLDTGDRMYVGQGDRIRIRSRSTGTLIFRGGAVTVLCAGTRAEVGRLWSDGVRPVVPNGTLTLGSGRILADTASTSRAFRPLALSVQGGRRTAANQGAAWFAVGRDVEVAIGEVRVDGTVQPPTGGILDCGDRRPVPPPPAGTPSASPSPSPTLTPSPTPSPSVTASTRPTVPGSPPRTTRPPATVPTSGTVTTTPPLPSPTTSQPPPNNPPTVRWTTNVGGPMTLTYKGKPCTDRASSVIYYTAYVVDDQDSPEELTVILTFSGVISGSVQMNPDGDYFYGGVGPFEWEKYRDLRGTINVTITAVDSARRSSSLPGASISLIACPLIG